jgi:uracil-DNA glycosylase family 4
MSLERRRAELWQAMGLGPEWLLRDSAAAGGRDRAASRAPGPAADAAAGTSAGAPGTLDARGGEIAAMDWERLEAAVASCTACPLCGTRKQTVFGVGNRTAPWMLIGEAPGAEEDARGEPFVGQAGKLLDNMLAAVGRSRAADARQPVFIANVLKCRPPGNRNPQPEEVAACEPFLLRQMELVRPTLVLVLGRFAAQSVLHTDAAISALRGRVHRLTISGSEVPAIVTYHPAYLLRNLADKSKVWADLCLALDVADAAPASQRPALA